MSRDPALYLEDMLEACDKLGRYVEGITQQQLAEDEMRMDAVVRNIELIGEAAAQLPGEVRAQITGVPWREMIGMRNILVHVYFGIDPNIVWEVATEKAPDLARAIRVYLNHQED